jgi:hypothetical protein
LPPIDAERIRAAAVAEGQRRLHRHESARTLVIRASIALGAFAAAIAGMDLSARGRP